MGLTTRLLALVVVSCRIDVLLVGPLEVDEVGLIEIVLELKMVLLLFKFHHFNTKEKVR